MVKFLMFFKELFMVTPDTSCVGLSGLKPKKKVKEVVKSTKKSQQSLTELMKRKNKKIEV